MFTANNSFGIKQLRKSLKNGVNLTDQDARIQVFYFNISEIKLSTTSLYIISDALKGIVHQFWIYNIFFVPNRKKHIL